MEDEELLIAHEIILLSHHNYSLSAMFRNNTRLIYFGHCFTNYALTFELQYEMQFL